MKLKYWALSALLISGGAEADQSFKELPFDHCHMSKITRVMSRLQNDPSSGTWLVFADGLSAGGYDNYPDNHIGDRVKICYADVEVGCPASRPPTRTYVGFNMITGAPFVLLIPPVQRGLIWRRYAQPTITLV